MSDHSEILTQHLPHSVEQMLRFTFANEVLKPCAIVPQSAVTPADAYIVTESVSHMLVGDKFH